MVQLKFTILCGNFELGCYTSNRENETKEFIMLKIVSGWVFILFLYFKIAFDAGFYDDISIIASLLLAIVLGIFIYFVSGAYTFKLMKYHDHPGQIPTKLWRLANQTIWPFLGMCLGSLIVSRLLIFGFSKELNDEIDLFDRRGNVEDEFIMFVFIILIPVLIHYAMSLFPAYLATKR